MKIYILNDDFFQREYLKTLISNIYKKNSWKEPQIAAFARPELLISDANQHGTHNIYILDIQINRSPMNGFEAAQNIRKFDSSGFIIFVSPNMEYLAQSFRYRVSALDFIFVGQETKAIEKQLEECLQYTINRLENIDHKELFVLNTPQTTFQLPFSDIYFFETSEYIHKVNLVAKNRNISFYSRLNDIEKLDFRFIRCHQSFVINIENVVELDKKNRLAIFSNGCTCFISRAKVKIITNELLKLNNS